MFQVIPCVAKLLQCFPEKLFCHGSVDILRQSDVFFVWVHPQDSPHRCLVEVIRLQELFERGLFFRNQEEKQVCPKKYPFVRKLSEFDLEIGRQVEKVVPPGRFLDEIEGGAVLNKKIL